MIKYLPKMESTHAYVQDCHFNEKRELTYLNVFYFPVKVKECVA